MLRKLTLILTLLLLVALSVPAFAQDAMGPSVMVSPDGEVVLGLAAALSGEGLAPFGEDIQRGAELALTDRPTVTVGEVEFPVTLDVQDDLCSAEGGQAVASRYVTDASVVAVVGMMCSSACQAAAPLLDDAGYSSISPSCTAENLTQQDFTSFNRTAPPDKFQGVAAAEILYNVLGVRKIATIHDGSPYGEGLVNGVSAQFTELGGEVVAADAVNVGDTDFRALLEEFAAAEPELIYFGGFAAEGARLAIQRKDAGLGDVIFFGADGIKGGEFPGLAGADVEGVYSSAAIPPADSQEEVDRVLAMYLETYGLDPTGPFWPNSYDAVNIILDGVEAVGTIDDNGDLVIDRAALSEYIRTLKDFEGLTGILSCDETGECAGAVYGFIQYDADGEEVLVATATRQSDGSMLVEEAGG